MNVFFAGPAEYGRPLPREREKLFLPGNRDNDCFPSGEFETAGQDFWPCEGRIYLGRIQLEDGELACETVELWKGEFTADKRNFDTVAT